MWDEEREDIEFEKAVREREHQDERRELADLIFEAGSDYDKVLQMMDGLGGDMIERRFFIADRILAAGFKRAL